MSSGPRKQYAVKDLSVGMYVTSIIKPISQTPFPLQGFYIKTKEQITLLSRYCNTVVVNSTKSKFIKDFHITMELDVIDIPAALTDPKGFRLKQAMRPPKKVNPRQKGRVKRLLVLFAVCISIWYFLN